VLFVPAPMSPSEKIEFFATIKSLFPDNLLINSIAGQSVLETNKNETDKIANELYSIESLERKND